MPGGAGAVGGAGARQHPRPGAPLGLHPSPAPRPVCPLFTPLPGRQGNAHLHVSAFSTASGLPDATVRLAGCVCHGPLLPRQAELTSPAAFSALAGLLYRSRQGSGTPLTQGQNDLGVGGVVVRKVDALDRPLVREFFEEVGLFSLVS